MKILSKKASQAATCIILALASSLGPATSKALGDDLGPKVGMVGVTAGILTVMFGKVADPLSNAFYEAEIARQISMGSKRTSTTLVTVSAFSESDRMLGAVRNIGEMNSQDAAMRGEVQSIFDTAAPLSQEKWRALRKSALEVSRENSATHFQILTDTEAFDGVGTHGAPLRSITELDGALVELSNSPARAVSVRMVSINQSLGTVDELIADVSQTVKLAKVALNDRRYARRVIMTAGGVMIAASAAVIIFSK